jgi:hypothetical protein
VVTHGSRDADPAGLCERFQARRDIDAIAEDVVAISDDVAEVDADAKPDLPFVGRLGLAVDHPALHLGSAAHRVDDARKFNQQAVAGGLDDAALVLLDLRIDQLPANRLQAFVRGFLVRAHQTRIPRHIGGEDRGETAGRGHGSSSPPCSRLSLSALYRTIHRATTCASGDRLPRSWSVTLGGKTDPSSGSDGASHKEVVLGAPADPGGRPISFRPGRRRDIVNQLAERSS